MSFLKPIDQGFSFDHIIATGGIGSGIFFSMSGNHTLGRNESRMATLLPYKDFCKQHIIMHYVAILLGAEIGGKFQSFPIGKVGNDNIGKSLIEQMKEVGMDTRYVTTHDNYSTLFSVCFQYPDSAGGNITSENSASSNVLPEDISLFFSDFKLSEDNEIILAIPEVPLQTRIELLQYGRLRGSLNVCSISSSEVNGFETMEGFSLTDILSINIDEARSIAQMFDESIESAIVIEACTSKLKQINPRISVLITDGARGNYCFKDDYLSFTPTYKVEVVSTAGAGDAFLAGTIAGLCCGLPLSKKTNSPNFLLRELESAVELGTLLAAMSVTSPDTIHGGVKAQSLYEFAKSNEVVFEENFIKLFADCM